MSSRSTRHFQGLLPTRAGPWIATNAVAWLVGVFVALFVPIVVEQSIKPPGLGRNLFFEAVVAPTLIGLIFGTIVGGAQWLALGRPLGPGVLWVAASAVWWAAGLLLFATITDSATYWRFGGAPDTQLALEIACGLFALVVPWLLLRPWSRRPWVWALFHIVASLLAVTVLGAVGGAFGYLLLSSSFSSPYIDGLGIILAFPLGGAIYGAITWPELRRAFSAQVAA